MIVHAVINRLVLLVINKYPNSIFTIIYKLPQFQRAVKVSRFLFIINSQSAKMVSTFNVVLKIFIMFLCSSGILADISSEQTV